MSILKTFGRKEITRKSVEECVRYFAGKNYSVYEEVGISKVKGSRVDVVAFNMKGEIVFVEIKSCWQDFASDTKWTNYLEYCNKFYFCIPEWLYKSDKGEFIEGICKEHKIGLFVLGCSWTKVLDGKPGEPEISINKQGEKELRVWFKNMKSSRKRKVCGKNRRWLITKLAWRGGLCVANLNPHRGTYLRQKYEYDTPISEHDFINNLDEYQQKEYLKRFPNSSFKSKLRDPEVQISLRQTRNKETDNEDIDKPKRRTRTVNRQGGKRRQKAQV